MLTLWPWYVDGPAFALLALMGLISNYVAASFRPVSTRGARRSFRMRERVNHTFLAAVL